MRVARQVAEAKFAREIELLDSQRSDLTARGIFVLGSPAYPRVDLLFVPRNALVIQIQAQQSGMIVLPAGSVLAFQLPSLAARSFKVRVDLSDFDMRAPSVEFMDPWTDLPLTYELMFRALEFDPARGPQLVLLPDHPITHKPFLCLRGIREYHEHPQHTGDDWMLYRDQTTLFAVILKVWRTTIDIVQPHLVRQPQGLQVLWMAQEKP